VDVGAYAPRWTLSLVGARGARRTGRWRPKAALYVRSKAVGMLHPPNGGLSDVRCPVIAAGDVRPHESETKPLTTSSSRRSDSSSGLSEHPTPRRRALRPIPNRNRVRQRTSPPGRRSEDRRNSRSRRGHPYNRRTECKCAEEYRRPHCRLGHREGKLAVRVRLHSRRLWAGLAPKRWGRFERRRPRRRARHRGHKCPPGPDSEDRQDLRTSSLSGDSCYPVGMANYRGSPKERTAQSSSRSRAGTRRVQNCPRRHNAAAECMHCRRHTH